MNVLAEMNALFPTASASAPRPVPVSTLTGGLLVLNALHGEQQRPEEQTRGMWQRAKSWTPHMPSMPHMPAMTSVPDWLRPQVHEVRPK